MRPAGNDHWRSVDLADKLMHGASDFVTFRHVWLVAVHRLHRPSDNQQWVVCRSQRLDILAEACKPLVEPNLFSDNALTLPGLLLYIRLPQHDLNIPRKRVLGVGVVPWQASVLRWRWRPLEEVPWSHDILITFPVMAGYTAEKHHHKMWDILGPKRSWDPALQDTQDFLMFVDIVPIFASSAHRHKTVWRVQRGKTTLYLLVTQRTLQPCSWQQGHGTVQFKDIAWYTYEAWPGSRTALLMQCHFLIFPESVWAKGSSNSGGLSNIFTSSHLLILTSSHLHILTSSHLLIFTFAHLHIFSSSHILIFTSSHLHIFSSSHLLIFTYSHLHIFSSSHLLIFTSSHLHIFSSSHPHIFTSSHLHILTSSHLLIFTSYHLHIFTSSHPHILTSSHPHILTSSHLHIFSSSHHIFTSSHLHILSSPLALLLSCPLLFPSFLFLS